VNGRWSLPGIEGDPIHVRGNDSNPLEQVAGGMFGLKEIAETASSGEVFVSGLVVIVPNRGTITLDKGTIPMPTGRDVILESELDRWLSGQARRAQTWTAPGVLAVLDALGLADVLTYDQVVRAGFDGPRPVEAEVVDLFPPAPEPATAAGSSRAVRFDTAPAPAARPAGRSHLGRALALFAAVFCVLAVLISVFAPSHGSGTHSGSSHQPSPATSAPAAPFTPAPAVTTTAGSPLFPGTTKPCYPFQPYC
jgi:hypothetical protein